MQNHPEIFSQSLELQFLDNIVRIAALFSTSLDNLVYNIISVENFVVAKCPF